MLAYKCDICGDFQEGQPANKGLGQHIAKNSLNLNYLIISASVMTEGKSDLGLCPTCFMRVLNMAMVCQKSNYPAGEPPKFD